MTVGSSMNRIRKANMSAVLRILLYQGAISRVQLARLTSLSNTTITNLASELIQGGFIMEEHSGGAEKPGRQRPVGRPRRMLRLVPDARYVVGVHIGVGIYRVAVANMRADFVSSRIIEFDPTASASTVLNSISGSIQEVINESKVDPNRVLGIGVGASGLVIPEKGINVFAPRLNWRNVNVKFLLETHLGYPTCVDNNVRAMALGEAFFGAGQDVDVLAFVYGRIGVGAGLVVNGHTFRGSGAGAGEIGHNLLILPHTLPVPQGDAAGGYETLETLVAEGAILQEAEDLAEAHPESTLAIYLSDSANIRTKINCVFEAARAGDTLALEMIERKAHYLGIALANLTNTINPELILLGGMFAQGADLIIPVAEATLRRLAFAQLGDSIRIQPTSFGWRAGVVGACALALVNFLYRSDP